MSKFKKLRKAVRKLLKRQGVDGPFSGSPQHGHSVPGRWDGDRKHKPGSICKECQLYETLRELSE